MGVNKNLQRHIRLTDATEASSCGLLLKTKGFKVYHIQIHVEDGY